MLDRQMDEQFLRRALELAREGIGLASPNPYVGAVMVDNSGLVLGEGFHTYDRIKHAEIIALEQAGSKAHGATLYINLEPCSHQGRTGPCSDGLIAAGIRRVVASMGDPNPQVSGRGFKRLRDAGVEVEVGLFQEEAQQLNEAFAKYIRHHTPLVTLKTAMTLDGKIAPPLAARGAQRRNWITGELARAHVQELRHQHDAVMVGIGTVLADDPLLTDRSGRPRRRTLLRLILDSRLRLPLDSQVVKSAKNDVLVICSSPDEKKQQQLRERGVCVERTSVTAPNARPDLPAVLRPLGEMEITSLLIEGGSTINGAALAAGIVDKVFFYYAPKVLGPEAVPFSADPRFQDLSNIPQAKRRRTLHFGEDFAIEACLLDPYE